MAQVQYGRPNTFTFITDSNPFAPASNPQAPRNYYEPGTPWWWLDRLMTKLMDRMERYDTLENYALGYHPLPNLDYRYVKALRDLQKKARTNYCELVIKATVDRMKVKGFRFGPVGEADKDAKAIWDYNDMDYQSPMNINLAATFGFCYALIQAPDPTEEGSQPIICIEDPRTCIVEHDPYRPMRSVAGLKIWMDDILEAAVAMLYLPDYVYTFISRKTQPEVQDQDAFLTKTPSSSMEAGSFELVLIQNNTLGEVPLVEGRWQPSFGDIGRSEHEGVLDIQDRINHTILDRLIIAKSQAYQQRWVSGVSLENRKGKKAPAWDPGADMIWITPDQDAKFGSFDAADITQLIEATKDDIGNLAAISQTPAGYLMNQLINVSGDTLTKEQAALVTKIRIRSAAIGWFYERCMKLAFKYLSDERYRSVEASTLWEDPEIHTMAELSDSAAKWIAAGVPLQLIMEKANFSPDEIEWAIKERDRMLVEQAAREDAVAAQENDHAIQQIKAKPAPKASTN